MPGGSQDTPRPRAARPRRASAEWSGAEFERRIGCRFHNPGLLRQALTHRSWTSGTGGEPDYERLEFLGDAVLGLRVSERLLESFPDRSEGHLSRLRSWLVSARNLALGAQALGVGQHLRMGPGEEAVGGRGHERLLANAMEAVIGAIHLDRGYRAAARFIDDHVLGTALEDLTPDHLHEFAYKSALQEWAHAQGHPLPRYRLLGATGPEHGKTFDVEVVLAGLYAGQGRGHSKKDAEQRAARGALEHLGVIERSR